VQVQLDSIGDPWKQPRFDSLPHVVGVLTSPNPEQTLQSLREQRDLVEHLVDGVVHNYNTGFSKAIQNYSQVCLFVVLSFFCTTSFTLISVTRISLSKDNGSSSSAFLKLF
jgi:hypothetical protein